MEHGQRQELVDAKAAVATTTVATVTANVGVNAAAGAVETLTADKALAARRLIFADGDSVGTFDREAHRLRAVFCNVMTRDVQTRRSHLCLVNETFDKVPLAFSAVRIGVFEISGDERLNCCLTNLLGDWVILLVMARTLL